MNIPFVDLVSQYTSIKDEIDNAFYSSLNTGEFIGGDSVRSFETAFSKYVNRKYCISCANGTDSIEILLEAFGVKKGDEVIVPAYSWISTSESVSRLGAKPVFVDIEKDFYCIDANLIESKITPNTKGIIPVHFYGQPANMPQIMAIANKYKLFVIEDCAQAHGAEIYGKNVGSWGHAASFSFYPGKNLGAYGDAGAIVTDLEEIAIKCKKIANHGQLKKHEHSIEGRNSRLDTIQAKILLVKLNYLNTWNLKRIKNAKYYNTRLNPSNIILPSVRENSKHVFHLYVIRTKRRGELISKLEKAGVQTAIHYPKPLPFLECYTYLESKQDDFPVACSIQNEILSIPMYPELAKMQMDYIIGIINE
ncbi:MAG: DegT/DnrJ/EryC1/StrS family aminotransferase [Hydrotalea sp.]|nr:DegT/DnrJ/EryC1/StrS family aminotransferase [Hydrotalea sp.]